MAKLKRNHYIPDFILRNWLSSHEGRQELHLYEIAKDQKGTRGANNKFKFAAGTDLYVPKIDGARNTDMEEWFSRCENALASLVQAVKSEERPISITRLQHSYIEKAIHGLRYRSRHDIAKIREAVDQNDEIRRSITCFPDRSTQRIVLENIRNSIEHETLRMHPLSLSFMEVEEGGLLLSDRPWLDDPKAKQLGKFVIITNRVALHYEKSTRQQFEFQTLSMPNEIRDILNEHVALHAREWLVADNERLLDQYIEVVRSPRWEAARDADHLLGFKPVHLRGGADFEGPQPD